MDCRRRVRPSAVARSVAALCAAPGRRVGAVSAGHRRRVHRGPADEGGVHPRPCRRRWRHRRGRARHRSRRQPGHARRRSHRQMARDPRRSRRRQGRVRRRWHRRKGRVPANLAASGGLPTKVAASSGREPAVIGAAPRVAAVSGAESGADEAGGVTNTVSPAGGSPASVAAEAPTMVAASGGAGGADGRRRVPQAAQNASVAEMLAAQLGQLLGTVVWGARCFENLPCRLCHANALLNAALAQTRAAP